MDAKKIPFWWAALIGLAFPILQALIFLIRFGGFGAVSSVLDYVMFFAAGALGGLTLIFFLRRGKTNTARWIMVGAYLLVTPVAVAGMAAGGLLGPVGVVLFSFTPWVLFLWIGYFAGGFFRDK